MRFSKLVPLPVRSSNNFCRHYQLGPTRRRRKIRVIVTFPSSATIYMCPLEYTWTKYTRF